MEPTTFIPLFTKYKNVVMKTEGEGNHLEDLSEDGRLILEYVLKDTQVFLQLIARLVLLFLYVTY
jgi:hypothetical protein